jgi:glutamate dehydrogenase (NAD(P)+)
MEEVIDKLEKKLKNSYDRVSDYAKKEGLDMRTAAYCIAIARIEKAYIQRGIFP